MFWIHASNATRVEQSFRGIAKRARINNHDNPEENIFELVQDWLLDPKNGHWALVIDNLDDDIFIQQSVASDQANDSTARQGTSLWDYLPQSLAGSIVVTSRDKNVALETMEHAEILFVGPMDQCHAVALLEKKLGPQFQADEAIQLAEALDFMPLAIAQAASHIRQRAPRLSTQQYLEALNSGGEGSSHPLSTYEEPNIRRGKEARNAIFSTWQLSFDHISKTRHSAANLLSLMSFFDRQGIPDFVLEGYTTGSTFDDSEKEANAGPPSCQDKQIFEDDILVLRNYSLISLAADGTSFEMHRLVQRAMQEWLRIHNQAERWIKVFLHSLHTRFSSLASDHWPTYQLLFPHVQRLVINKPQTRASLLKWSSVIRWAAVYAMSSGKYSIAEEMARLAMDTREDQLGPEDWRTISAVTTLGEIFIKQGKFKEAGNILAEILKIQRRKLNLESGHTELIAITESLAAAYRHQSRWNKAKELQSGVVNNYQQKLGPDRSRIIGVAHDVAALDHSLCNWEEAERILRQVTDASMRVMGPEHSNTLAAMETLASVYCDQNRLEDAEELETQVMNCRERVLGSEHVDTLKSMANLVRLYRYQRRWKEAEEIGKRVISGRERILGSDHPSTLWSISYLALVYHHQTRWKKAEELWRQVMNTRERVLGIDHPDTILSMENLMRACRDQKHWKDAEALVKQLINARERVLGPDHPDTLLSMGDLLRVYRGQKRWGEAEERGKRLIIDRKRVLGPDHPDTLSSMGDLVRVYSIQKRWEEAERLGRKLVDTRERVLGIDHHNTLLSVESLMQAYNGQKRWKEAEQLGRQLMSARERVLGPDHPDTVSSMQSLARVYRRQAHYEKAEEIDACMLDISKRVMGPDNTHTIRTMHNLALDRYKIGRIDCAISLMAECAQISEQALGRDDQYTQNSLEAVRKWQTEKASSLATSEVLEGTFEGGTLNFD